MSRAEMDQRAQSLIGEINWHCCKYVGYIIYGDQNENRGGAKGWQTFGTATDSSSEAKVIIVDDGKHVGYVTNNGNTVYDSPGAGRNKPIRKTDFKTWIGWFSSYKLRK